MINKKIKLNPDLFEENIDKKPTRDGFGDGVVEVGKEDERIVVLTADLSESTRANKFAEEFPNRFFNVGIAEQNLASVASGLAAVGKIPFATSYAMFSPGRNWEQIRTTICYNDQPVKIVGSHSGLTTGPDGGTHQALEDIAITRVLPRMIVICPCDYEEAKKATIACAKTSDPTYLRLSREKTPQITTKDTPFEIGKAIKVFESKEESVDVGIISTGILLHKVLKIANDLEQNGTSVEVLNIHTIKPIDESAIIELAKKSGAIVTVEEHQIVGGLGSAVAEVLAKNLPTPIEFVGVSDQYGQSGNAEELFSQYKIDESAILESVEKVISRKTN
ncbi:MAG TPA: transketolase family protein [Candidatus Paceibacterota bacterium]|nr:transketolase family protein [Candidatus Paceibacterota bacterium]HMP19077.1 transketolase family protein [Candidatus Paceibacterota bacterium]HMP85427.1 transketolase family protein [Candidatus Paceibacterota bacterium]